MALIKVFVMAAVVVACVHARNMGMQGDEGYGQMSQGFGSRGQRQAQRQGQDDQGRGGKRLGGGEQDQGKFRTNLYNDDDVYGYDATYPGGEARFITYKNSDARARRGPEFARSNSFGGGQGGQGNERSGRQGPSGARAQRSSSYDNQQPQW